MGPCHHVLILRVFILILVLALLVLVLVLILVPLLLLLLVLLAGERRPRSLWWCVRSRVCDGLNEDCALYYASSSFAARWYDGGRERGGAIGNM